MSVGDDAGVSLYYSSLLTDLGTLTLFQSRGVNRETVGGTGGDRGTAEGDKGGKSRGE